MANQNNSKDENEKDKTVIFNSGADRKKMGDDDKTKVEQTEPKKDTAGPNNSGKADSEETAPKDNPTQNAASPTVSDLKNAQKSDKNSVSAGVFAAGAAGAAAAGVAAGTIYSDEIKGFFAADTFDAPESPEEEIQDATEQIENSAEDTPDALATSMSTPTGTDTDSLASEMTFEFSDENGVYEVSMVDLDSDGELDTLTADAQLVDGSSVSFTAAGDTLHNFFTSDQFEIAEPADYVGCCGADVFDNFGPESLGAESYHIQSGDTLSEIAAAHNTSIGDLLDLNPHITDANVIYAGDDIMIPIGDNDTNPYAGWSPSEPSIGTEYGEEIFFTDESDSSSEFSEMDWQSFEDEPVDEYCSALDQMDFSSMETPDSYLDYGNDLDSLDFI
jgi:hypothetical protein